MKGRPQTGQEYSPQTSLVAPCAGSNSQGVGVGALQSGGRRSEPFAGV